MVTLNITLEQQEWIILQIDRGQMTIEDEIDSIERQMLGQGNRIPSLNRLVALENKSAFLDTLFNDVSGSST